MATTKSSDFKKLTVCKICFNSSRDKSNPLLTSPGTSANQSKSAKSKNECPAYRHTFIPVTVYQEPDSLKWETIRENVQVNRICPHNKEGKCRFGQSCKSAHNDAELAQATLQKVRRQQKLSSSEVNRIRKPPPIRVCNKYKICRYNMEGRCYFGRYCTFAHSEAELQTWIQRRHPTMSTKGDKNSEHFSNAPIPKRGFSTMKSSPTESTDTKLMPAELKQESDRIDSLDFASKIRSEIVTEYREDKVLSSCFDESYENVTIQKTSDLELSLIVSNDDVIQWTFEISVESAQTLSSIILFDTLVSGFEIHDPLLENMGTKKHTKLPVIEHAQQGIGLRFDREFGRNEIVLVKVTCKPCSGLLGQLVIFCFTSPFRNFFMMRKLCVYMRSDVEMLHMLSMETQKKKANVDLFWEQHHEIIPMDAYPHAEEVDKELPEYIPSENVLELGNNQNVRVKLTKDNYKERMHYLLYLEEHEHKKIMSRYDLHDMEITPQRSRQQGGQSINAPANFYFATLTLSEMLFEGRKSIRPGDDALIKCGSKVYQCVVCDVGRESVTLKISKKTSIACINNSGKCSVRFVLGRLPIRAMHYAVDHVDLNTIFPKVSPSLGMENPSAFKKCKADLKSSNLNQLQNNAVINMLKHSSANIPSLVLGPFGSGKTRTLQLCVLLIAKHYPDAHVLVCTHSNSAADLYVKYIDAEWEDAEKYLFRLYYSGRSIFSIPESVRKYCRFDGMQLLIPTKDQIQEHKIVVTTLLTARVLFLMGIKRGYFSHIFIDEAAQALETEAIIPLCLADGETKLVLAGDYMQLVPPVYSPIAKHNCFHITLLERLYDHDVYKHESTGQCRTLLTENYRSRPEILALPSNLFYGKQLTCSIKFSFERKLKDIPPLKFVGVSGRECRDMGSPSYYNHTEAVEVTKQVKQLVSKGLKPDEICVLAYDKVQIDKIRILLRGLSLKEVQAHRVHNVQGGEFRALIVSTVRTCLEESQEEGFLNDPKLLNTTITRAREWLIIVGEPITLCTVGSNCLCWKKIIKTCLKQNTFEYPNAESFLSSLENKHVARELLETAFSGLLEDTVPKKNSDSAFQQQVFEAPSQDPHSEPQNEQEIPKEPEHNESNQRQQEQENNGAGNKSGTDCDEPTLIPLRPPDNQRSNSPAQGHVYNHQQLLFSHQNFPQPQFAHYPQYPQPSTFQHGMYPAQYPLNAGHLHAPYPTGAFPYQPLQPSSFPQGASFYPPSSYAYYRYPSQFPPQQPAASRFGMGPAASHEQATFPRPTLGSFAEQPYHPRGVYDQYPYYQAHARPPVQTNSRFGQQQSSSNLSEHNSRQADNILRSQPPVGYPPEYPPSATQSPISSNETEIEDIVILKNKTLGFGAFGYVFEGKYKLTDQKCAVKVLNRVGIEISTNLPTATMQGNDDEALFNNFRKECALLESLDHPNIVKHLATRFYPNQNIPIIVMELLSCSLKDYIKKLDHSLLPFLVQLCLDRDIASALAFLHSKSIVHRDLCEDNILLLIQDGQIPVAKVSDFGMSKLIDLEQMSISLSSVRHRTAYLPPEVLNDPKSYDASIDIFMFGVVMVQIAHSVPKVDSIDTRQELLRTISDNHPLKNPVDLFELCVKDVKEDRPKAQKVFKIIMDIIPNYMSSF